MSNQCKHCGRLLLIAQIPMGYKQMFMNANTCFKCSMGEVRGMSSSKVKTTSEVEDD